MIREPQAAVPLNAEWSVFDELRPAHLFGQPIGGAQRSLCGAVITHSHRLRLPQVGCLKCETCRRTEAKRMTLLQAKAMAEKQEARL